MNNIDMKDNNKEKESMPRVLVIAHNPFSDTQNNGKTLTALFRYWQPDCLAQIYLTSELPDFSICKKYFRLSDRDAFDKAVFFRKTQGREIFHSTLGEKKAKKEKFIRLINMVARMVPSSLLLFSRDLIWKIAGYKTPATIHFIDEYKPQIVFFQASSGIFAFSLVRWICKSKNIPLVMQITDDYVTGKWTLDPFFWYHLFKLQSAYRWACLQSSCIFAIGDKMAREFKQRFGGNYLIAMNAVDNLNLAPYTPSNKTIKFVYAGNLQLNRWKVLVWIAECIEELHNEEELSGELTIYSLIDPGERIKSLLNKPPYCHFKGALDSDGLNRVREDADVLVHVEAFDRKSRHMTRLSVSTKIPEYLASGRCILAVGPGDVASIEYLAENDLGIIASSYDKKAIKRAVKEAMMNDDRRMYYAQRGLAFAKIRHNADEVASTVVRVLSESVKT